MATTISGHSPCYICGIPTRSIVSVSRAFPPEPANPRDAVAICPDCKDDWKFALCAREFTGPQSTFIATPAWLKDQPKPTRHRGR